MSAQHLTGWRLSAGDEHTVFDGRSERLVSVPCGGMSGRTFAEAADCTRLIAAAPELLAALEDARATIVIMRGNVLTEIGKCADPSESRWAGVPDELEKRIKKIDAAIAKVRGAS